MGPIIAKRLAATLPSINCDVPRRLVEKFIGDADGCVRVPVSHEHDALRACRAAMGMRDVFPKLEIAGGIGVNTGEVVTGTEQRLATRTP